MKSKKTVAILYGGRSVEHEISIKSAKNVCHYLDKSKHEIIIIGISKSGKWWLKDKVSDQFENGTPISMSMDATSSRIIAGGREYTIDVVFPVLHGTDGEDGSIQGMLQSMDIPFVGSGVLGSSVAMNKLLSKRLLQAANIPVCAYHAVHISERDELSFDEFVKKVGMPMIVKPVNLGSSVGVTKVSSASEFAQAIELGFKYDQLLLIEEFVVGRELECAVLGNGASAKASFPGEIVIGNQYEFYSYQAKYENENAVQIQIPARINESVANRIKELSVQSFRALQCNDFARIDLFLTKDDEVLINEINTIPGFTNISMFPSLWKQHGIEYRELLTQIIEYALHRYLHASNMERSVFNSY